jgi:hypothetical protein
MAATISRAVRSRWRVCHNANTPQVSGKSPVLKIVGLFKRKPGLSVQEFRDYYEQKHLRWFHEHVALPGVLRYSRRYLNQIDGMMQKLPTTTGGYDVIMEVSVDNLQSPDHLC